VGASQAADDPTMKQGRENWLVGSRAAHSELLPCKNKWGHAPGFELIGLLETRRDERSTYYIVIFKSKTLLGDHTASFRNMIGSCLIWESEIGN